MDMLYKLNHFLGKFGFQLVRKIKNSYSASVPCDLSHCFDSMAILETKLQRKWKKTNSWDQQIKLDMKCLFEHILSYISQEKYHEVMASMEYRQMVKVNCKLYDYVDAVKLNPCLGKEIDIEVYNRFLAKKTLQEKFFPEFVIKEQKIGYGDTK